MEAWSCCLQVYLRKGPTRAREEVRSHDLGKLFMKWDEQGRTKAELAYQDRVLEDLEANRIYEAASQTTLNIGPHGQMPTDYSERKAEYDEAFNQCKVKLLHEGSPTVQDVVGKLDASLLGPRNITWLCNPTHADMIKGFPCNRRPGIQRIAVHRVVPIHSGHPASRVPGLRRGIPQKGGNRARALWMALPERDET